MINDPEVRPFSEVDGVAVALIVAGDGGQHCGLIHRLDEEQARHVHLAWHFRLRAEEPSNDCFWVDLASLEVPEKRLVGLLARQIGDRREPIPYGLGHVGLRFDQDGRLTGVRTGQGFTCATFVLSVFASYGFELVDRLAWPLHANDEWQNRVVQTLELPASGASAEHVEVVRGQVGAQRVCPAEVAGAAASSGTPVSFEEAQELAAAIIHEVARLRAARVA